MSALATTRAGAGKLEQWATAKAIAAVEGCTDRAIRIRAQGEHWRSRSGEKGSNGKPIREYLPPIEIQFKLANAALAMVATPSAAAPQHRLLDELSPEERAQYEERRGAILLLEQLQKEGHSKTEAVRIAAERTGKGQKFVWHWSSEFSKGGLAALIPPKHNKNSERRASLRSRSSSSSTNIWSIVLRRSACFTKRWIASGRVSG